MRPRNTKLGAMCLILLPLLLLQGCAPSGGSPPSIRIDVFEVVAGKAEEPVPERTDTVPINNCQSKTSTIVPIQRSISLEHTLELSKGEKTGTEIRRGIAFVPSIGPISLGFDAEDRALQEVFRVYGITTRTVEVNTSGVNIESPPQNVTTVTIEWKVTWTSGRIHVKGVASGQSFEDWFPFRLKYSVQPSVTKKDESCSDIGKKEAGNGDEAMSRKDFASAVSHYTTALGYLPKDDSIYVRRGEAQRELKNFAEAQKDCNTATSINAFNVGAWWCKIKVEIDRRR